MATNTTSQRPSPPEIDKIPPLRNGDHLSRPEFERRYAAMPHVKKAELIGGIVYMPEPVPFTHGKSHAEAVCWLGHYAAYTPGVEASDGPSIRLDLVNMPEPDGCLLISPSLGGSARIGEGELLEGPPELIFEIAYSRASRDLHEKLRVYHRNAVREYLVWRTEDRALGWLVLRDGEYVPMSPSSDGLLRSEVFPGLWLDPEAMLHHDLARVLAVVKRGLQSPEHAAFIKQLRQKAAILEAKQP